MVALDDRGNCKVANIALLGVGEKTLLAKEAAKQLVGRPPSDAAIKAAAEIASTKEIDPGSDIHATDVYRQHVTLVLIQRALNEAFDPGHGARGGCYESIESH